MKKVTFYTLLILFTTAACSLTGQPQRPPQPPTSEAVLPATKESSSSAPQPTQEAGERVQTLLYISGTTHIETLPKAWPDPDTFLEFLEQVTSLGMRWSVGADVGWLEGEPRAAEIVQKSLAWGVQWDVHTHQMGDRARAAHLLSQYGAQPTGVYSGFLIDELEQFLSPLSYQGTEWTPQVLWGAVACPGHRPGCDEASPGVWIPLNSENYLAHDPSGQFIHVGGGTHQLSDARLLVNAIQDGQYTYPVISFTLMIAPDTLTIVKTSDGMEALTVFYNEVNDLPFIRWATIQETADAWVTAGSVPSRIETE